MSSPLAYGIDFGTTNSSIAVAYPDRVELVRLDTNPTMPYCLPSIVYLHEDDEIKEAGKEALESYDITGPLRDPEDKPISRLIFEIKTALTAEGISESYRKLPERVAVILSTLKEKADQHTGERIDKAVIGHPVNFVGATGPDASRLNKLAKERLEEAARISGFKEIELYPEPDAAVLGAAVLGEVPEDEITITVDFGGGTLDVAVVKGLMDKTGSQGAEVGGSLFDELIFDHKLTDILDLNSVADSVFHRAGGQGVKIGRPIDYRFRDYLRGRRGFHRLFTYYEMAFDCVEEIKKSNLQAGEYLSAIIFGGQAANFYSAIENAKIALTDQLNTYIDCDSAGLDNLRIPLQRDEFDQWITPHMNEVQETIQRAMDEAAVSSRDVKAVIRTGGSSQLVAFTNMLNDMFSPEKILSLNPFATVAYGLGVQAQRTWASPEQIQPEPPSPKITPSEPLMIPEPVPEEEPNEEPPEATKEPATVADKGWNKLGKIISHILLNFISKLREKVFRRR